MQKNDNGIITTYILVFGVIFLILFSGLLNSILIQLKQADQKVVWNKILDIAESGLNYAKWHLAHSPSDFNFSGDYDYKDPEGEIIGKYHLEITAPSGCNSSAIIKSTGWTTDFPNLKRTTQIKYAKVALAKYGFLSNNSVWFGTSEELKGPFHSNNGIRMDGLQNSISTSAKETYICGAEHGCSQTKCSTPCQWTADGCQCPGIWCCPGGWCVDPGNCEGKENGLWEFPTSNVDFDNITRDLATIKQIAQESGIYLSNSGFYGYHVKFLSNGTFDVYKVKSLKEKVWGYDGANWVYESNDIATEEFYLNYSLPTNCAPIFIEDNVWIDGDVNGRTTLAAAKFPDLPQTNAKIIIANNINYTTENSVLGLIAQKDILIPLYSPNNLEIKAALLAQKGHVFRYYYPSWNWEPYKTYAIRNYIETYGSIISNTTWTFSWVNSKGNIVSGYRETEMSYNSDLTYNPPPYFPVSGEYKIIKWEEIQ